MTPNHEGGYLDPLCLRVRYRRRVVSRVVPHRVISSESVPSLDPWSRRRVKVSPLLSLVEWFYICLEFFFFFLDSVRIRVKASVII